MQRVLDRLDDAPVLVIDAAWEIDRGQLAWPTALIGDVSAPSARERNIVWRELHRPRRHGSCAPPEEAAVIEAQIVADLHAALGRYPEDEPLQRLIEDLRAAPARASRSCGSSARSRRTTPRRKTIAHPEVGTVTLDCDVLTVGRSDLRLIIYTAPPGSPDARALALLGAVGLQSFA